MSKTVLISAGHSVTDPGAIHKFWREADYALKLRDKIARLLKQRGVSVLRDGVDGVNDPLNKAIALAKTVNGRAVEIHFNAGPAGATGIEALCKPANKKLAQDLCQAVHDRTSLKLRGDLGYKPDSSGQHHRLGFCEAGGVILEVCFISNESDMNVYIANEDFIAANIADVLAKLAG